MWLRAGSSAQHVVRAVRNCPLPPGAWWWVTELWLPACAAHSYPRPTRHCLDLGTSSNSSLTCWRPQCPGWPLAPPGWPGSYTVRWRVVVPPAGRAWPCWARACAPSHTASWPVFLPLRDPSLPSPENRRLCHGRRPKTSVQKVPKVGLSQEGKVN